MSSNSQSSKAWLATAALAATAGYWYMKRRRQQDPIPSDWLDVGTVEQLLVYPLKSGAPLKCTQFVCGDQGPIAGDSRDRVLAIVREDGSLVTGRDYPQLTQLSAEIKAGILTLAVGSLPRLSLDLNALESKDRHFLKIWKCETEGVDCGDAAAEYLTSYITTKVRLLYYPDRQNGKSVYQGFLHLPFIHPTDGGVFSDAMSFHLVNKTSVQELNSRLETKVDARNFRPNIVVEGEKLLPYEEDSWEWLKIGNVVFRALAPCTRCLFTTVNPDNGEKSETFEPLKTLRKYRVLRDPAKKSLFGSAPVMGVYLGVRGVGGIINAGDIISVPIKRA